MKKYLATKRAKRVIRPGLAFNANAIAISAKIQPASSITLLRSKLQRSRKAVSSFAGPYGKQGKVDTPYNIRFRSTVSSSVAGSTGMFPDGPNGFGNETTFHYSGDARNGFNALPLNDASGTTAAYLHLGIRGNFRIQERNNLGNPYKPANSSLTDSKLYPPNLAFGLYGERPTTTYAEFEVSTGSVHQWLFTGIWSVLL